MVNLPEKVFERPSSSLEKKTQGPLLSSRGRGRGRGLCSSKPHRKFVGIPKASTEDENNAVVVADESIPVKSECDEMVELGKEIKQMMKEREKESRFVSGVVEEIREIEWPAFGKVLGTTGVVLEVIVSSNVILLTVNVVLAEISDRVLGGKGVQDFFD